MSIRFLVTTLLAALFAFAEASSAADKKELPQVLFENVNIFNGTDDKLYENHSVLVSTRYFGWYRTLAYVEEEAK